MFDAPRALAAIARTAERIAQVREELRFKGVMDERTAAMRTELARLASLDRMPLKRSRERFAEGRKRALADLGIIVPQEKR